MFYTTGTMELERIKNIIAKQMPILADQYHVKQLGIFGSVARGDETDASDVDVVVEYSETPDLFDLIRLENHMAEAVGRKVDLVMKGTIKPAIRERVMNEIVYV